MPGHINAGYPSRPGGGTRRHNEARDTRCTWHVESRDSLKVFPIVVVVRQQRCVLIGLYVIVFSEIATAPGATACVCADILRSIRASFAFVIRGGLTLSQNV